MPTWALSADPHNCKSMPERELCPRNSKRRKFSRREVYKNSYYSFLVLVIHETKRGYLLTYVEITEKSSSYTLMVCKNIFPSCTSYLLWAMVIRLLIIFVHFKAKVVLSVEVIKRDVGKILIDKILHLGVTNRWTFPPRHIIRGHEASNLRDVLSKKI